MRNCLKEIISAMGPCTEYDIIPVICPTPTLCGPLSQGYFGLVPCIKERCTGYKTLLVGEKPQKYCRPFDMDLPVILRKRR